MKPCLHACHCVVAIQKSYCEVHVCRAPDHDLGNRVEGKLRWLDSHDITDPDEHVCAAHGREVLLEGHQHLHQRRNAASVVSRW